MNTAVLPAPDLTPAQTQDAARMHFNRLAYAHYIEAMIWARADEQECSPLDAAMELCVALETIAAADTHRDGGRIWHVDMLGLRGSGKSSGAVLRDWATSVPRALA